MNDVRLPDWNCGQRSSEPGIDEEDDGVDGCEFISPRWRRQPRRRRHSDT